MSALPHPDLPKVRVPERVRAALARRLHTRSFRRMIAEARIARTTLDSALTGGLLTRPAVARLEAYVAQLEAEAAALEASP